MRRHVGGQSVTWTEFGNASVVEHEDSVNAVERFQVVGDDQSSSPRQETPDGGAHELLGCGIKA